jgi:hypothetical protein
MFDEGKYRGVPLKLTFSERVAEVRVSPKFFRILGILFTGSKHAYKKKVKIFTVSMADEEKL